MNELAFRPKRQQFDAARRVAHWLWTETADKQIFRLFGYAGTGKTTLAHWIASNLKVPVVFAAFTGKAALRLQQVDCPDAATLHSFLYVPDEDEAGHRRWIRSKGGPLASAGLVVLDAASMVNE